ncbi:hypothetical protein Csa_019869 [Cucumis sativus]|nr:hypothetical protein Csa_019869 [Cucumis sativus]
MRSRKECKKQRLRAPPTCGINIVGRIPPSILVWYVKLYGAYGPCEEGVFQEIQLGGERRGEERRGEGFKESCYARANHVS